MRAWREGGLADRRGIDELLPLDGEAWIRAMETELREHPTWVEGAEQLAFRGHPAGRDLLLTLPRGQDPSGRKRAVVALAALGDGTGLREVVESGDFPVWTPKEEGVLLKVVDADLAERLRLWIWMNAAQTNAWPARALAAKRDPAMGAYYRRALRRDGVDNDVDSSTNLQAAAEAAADLGMSAARISFLRLLRSRAPTGRVLGARALARLDGRAAVPHLVPLLDDGEALVAGGRVRDRVVDVLEGLAGRAFTGPSRARVEAAREWASR